MVERARRSVGATIAAARAALARGRGRQPGRRHAPRQRRQGRRLLRLQRRGGGGAADAGRVAPRAPAQLLRVAVIDLDVHQGNGTAAIFRDDPTRVHAVAARREELPVPQGGRATSTSNCPTAAPTTPYLARARRARWPSSGRATRDAPPGLVFYLAGADPHEGDRLGRLKLSADGPGRARPPRARRAARARASRWRCRWPAATAATSTTTVAVQRRARWRAGSWRRGEAWRAVEQWRAMSHRPAARAAQRLPPLPPDPARAGWTTTSTATSTTSSTTAWFDTAVNRYLIEAGALDIHARRGDRPGGRDALQLLRAAGLPADGGGRPARGAPGPLERALRDRPVRRRRAAERRRAATSSTSTSTARRAGRSPLPAAAARRPANRCIAPHDATSPPSTTAAVDAAITSRRSMRAFLPTPVPRETDRGDPARRLARALGHQHAAVEGVCADRAAQGSGCRATILRRLRRPRRARARTARSTPTTRREWAVALHRPPPQGRLGPVRPARHRQDRQGAHARAARPQLRLLRRAGRA